MEDTDAKFAVKVKKGDIIVAGRNFGCGSSREHSPIAIKACGVSCVIAKSFARIFYRNAINIGLPIIASEEAVSGFKTKDTAEVNTKSGVIRNVSKRTAYTAEAYPPFIRKIIKQGGLLKNVK